jgi:hypothetical protein
VNDVTGGVFTVDFMAGCGIFVVLLAAAFYVAAGTISHSFTASYAEELHPLAVDISDMLVLGEGAPPDWHMSPSRAATASFIGLSDGRPCILSEEKVYSLGLFNESGLAGHLGLDDPERFYGVRIEVSADDGSVSVASGYVVENSTTDVCKCIRLVGIVDPEGAERSGTLIVYLWRKHEGTEGTYR